MSGHTAHPRSPANPAVPRALDVAVTLLASAAALVQLWHSIGSQPEPTPDVTAVQVALTLGSCLPLVAWRRSPVAVLVLTAVFNTLLAAAGQTIELNPGPAVALYLVATTRTRAAPWTGRTTSLTVALLLSYLIAAWISQQRPPVTELLHAGLLWGAAWFAGDRHRLRREQLDELRARADRIERDATRERLLAVAEERARIARDLHDSAGHAITLIAVRAGAARLRHHADPDRSLAALQAIEDLARQTAAEIDDTVRTLRTPGATDTEPAGGLATLELLVSRHARSGRPVTLRRTGEPRPLPAATDRAAYRIVQEALTNAAKYGAGRADVLVTYDGDVVELLVTNPIGPEPGTSGATGGHGLVGMQERAALAGGSVVTRRTTEAFELRARLPAG
ncbi:histidine kinase [Kribbella sp. NPDC050820]|uniref:sensor histidine kinase n=1 Tax=Kribbella sp. NPDC050820 TaxID=3155408 RepID=UPI0033E59C25